MLLILRSRAASSLFTGLFGSLKFCSECTCTARGCRCPTGAGGGPAGLLVFADDPPVPVCAIAGGPAIRTSSATAAIGFVVISLVVSNFRILLLPFSKRLHLSRPITGRSSLSADRDEPHHNNRRHDSAFPRPVHVLWKKNLWAKQNSQATDNSGRPAPCRGRREYRARNPVDIIRTPCPAEPALTLVHAPASFADARCPAPDRRGAGNRALCGIRQRPAAALPAPRRCH